MVNLGTESYIDIIAENESCIFDFSDPKFFLEERDIPVITCDLQTPIEYIKKVLKKYKNNLTSIHINAQSIPKHYDEIVRLLVETGVDILAVSETFVCEKTPKMFYEVPGYKFFHTDRTMQSRGSAGIYVKDGI